MIKVSEIQAQVRRRYLERLEQRSRKLRRLYADREWVSFRAELENLKQSAANFGFPDLVDKADQTLDSLPKGTISRAQSLPEARASIEALFSSIDTLLISDKVITLP